MNPAAHAYSAYAASTSITLCNPLAPGAPPLFGETENVNPPPAGRRGPRRLRGGRRREHVESRQQWMHRYAPFLVDDGPRVHISA